MHAGDLAVPRDRQPHLGATSDGVPLSGGCQDKESKVAVLIAEGKKRLARALLCQQLLELRGGRGVGSEGIGAARLGCGPGHWLEAEPVYGSVC
jgi:hypothetical protein